MADVQGCCPACGGSSLFLGEGGHVTCSRLDCPAPSTADDLLHEQPQNLTVGTARIALDVPTGLDSAPQPRRTRRSLMSSKPIREFTVFVTPQDPGTAVHADTVSTLGDWFTLTLNGLEVYGAPKDRVLQYTAKPAGEGT